MVSIQVKLFEPFAELIGHKLLWIEIRTDNTVGDVLTKLDQISVGRLKKVLFDATTQKPHQYIRVLVNGQDIAFLDGLKTVLKNKDIIAIISPVVGG